MTAARTRTRLAAAAMTVLGLGTVLGGCGGTGADTPTVSPTATLATAKQKLDSTSGVKIGLSTPALPTGVNGLLSATGIGTHDPAFQGTIKVAASGIPVDAAVVAVGGVVYAKLPFTTTYVPINPADYGAPDPADLMNTQGGLSSLLTSARQVTTGKQVRSGKDVLSSYTAKVPGTAVAALIPSASASADFDAVFTLTDQKRLAKVVLTGPFYPQAKSVSYTVTFDGYDTKKSITKP